MFYILGTTLESTFTALEKASTSTSADYQVYACYRHEYCPTLHIRDARYNILSYFNLLIFYGNRYLIIVQSRYQQSSELAMFYTILLHL